jgi:hypothetical protein
MHFHDICIGKGPYVFESFGFTAPNKRYPRLNHLFMSSLVCEDARKFFDAECHSPLLEVREFKTTCLSTTPEQKSHRSTGLKCVSRERMEDGRYKLIYRGPFKPFGWDKVLANWFERMRNVEKQTGRPMGIDMIPNAEQLEAGAEA